MSMNGAISDRLEALRSFDQTKKGVKGLVDAGITNIPPIFVHEAAEKADLVNDEVAIPTINLEAIHTSEGRKAIVEEVARACREIGFFLVVNHGIPLDVMERIIGSVKAFHELPGEDKSKFYTRSGKEKGVSYLSNVDLYKSKAASWRDTIQVGLDPSWPHLENIPEICRNEVVEWDEHSSRLAKLLLELLSEGLGLDSNRLTELKCTEQKTMAGHYYPWCPQPELTVGLSPHTDPGLLTMVAQDHVGGLQVKCGEKWVEIKPIPGALVINIGDIMQMMSNDAYLSGLHKVVTNHSKEPRVSVAVFFNPIVRETLLGPFPELTSAEKPPNYRQFTVNEYYTVFFNRELGDKSLKEHFKLIAD